MKQTLVLLDYLNEHTMSDTYSRIISYIFKTKAHIPEMTITEMAEAIFVTPSTITRFCKHFGFRSFLEFKEAVEAENQTDPTRLFRLSREEFLSISSEPYFSFEAYGQAIIRSIQDTINTVDITMIEQLIDLIISHENIMIFGYSTSIQTARSLQEGLILSNKLAYVGGNHGLQLELARSLTKDSLAIILSSYGNFFSNHSAIFDQILRSKCTTILLTQQQNNFFSPSIDHVFNINSESFQKVGSYSMNFFIDFLCRKYFDVTLKK